MKSETHMYVRSESKSKGKADRKEMNNVLKKTIREGILPVNTSPATPKEKKKSKAPQTERRLSKLLEKMRSKCCIRGSAKSSSKKMKKWQVKYERFDPKFKTSISSTRRWRRLKVD